jgi:hypothetical protein
MAVALNDVDVVAVRCTTWRAPTALITVAGASSHRAAGNTDTAISSPPPSSSAPGKAPTSSETPPVKPSR